MPDPIALTSNPIGLALAILILAVCVATKGLND